MFSKTKKRSAPPAPVIVHPPPPAPHKRNTSTLTTATTASNAAPLVSPLQMTFDFELPGPPPLSSPAFRPSVDSVTSFVRPRTSDGVSNLAPPQLPPIPRVASRNEGVDSSDSEGDLKRGKSKASAREDSDNVSMSSRKSRTRSKYFDPDFFASTNSSTPNLPDANKSTAREESDNVSMSSRKSKTRSKFFDRPDFFSSVKSSAPNLPDVRPATSAGITPGTGSSLFPGPSSSAKSSPQMESSLFPSREPSTSVLPPINTGPAMTRAWIDARDKPYSQPPARPPPLQPTQSTPDLSSPIRSPTTNFSTRNPLAGPSLNGRPGAQSTNSSPTVTQRPPTNYSGTTARSGQSSSPAAEPLAKTIGTPYGETAASFPLPKLVATRPKTAGGTSTATVAGVSIPTHHTKAEAPPTTKAEKRRTRLLNPMALLSRKKSGQDVAPPSSAEKAAQEQAVQRQKKVLAMGTSKPPEDFDPRIRGKVVHDFSAPRQTRRNVSYNDAEPWSPRQLPPATSAPSIPALQDYSAFRQSLHSNKQSDGSSRKSQHMAMFMEHFSDSQDIGRIQAERLENKNFLQRASQQSSVSQESAVLPPFARRSQVMDPAQASYYQDDESKRSSDPSSSTGLRDSHVSGFSAVSPVTARSSAVLPLPSDVRASMSPVSPSSPDKRGSAVSGLAADGRPLSDISSKAASPEAVRSEGSARPYSQFFAQQPAVEPIAEEEQSSPRLNQDNIVPAIPQRVAPAIPPRLAALQTDHETLHPPPALSPIEGSAPVSASASLINSGVSSPVLSSSIPTPEPQVAERVISMIAPTSPPKLVEKRASAVGHGKRKSLAPSVPRHVSNASRFSFQFGGSAAEEEALEEKHRKITSSGDYSHQAPHAEEEDEDDYFDEDAMDDMDEMEQQQQQQQEVDPVIESKRKSVAVSNFMYRPPTLRQSSHVRYSEAFTPEMQNKLKLARDESDVESDGITESDSDEDEAPYWMHEDFQGYSSESHSRTASSSANGIASTHASPGRKRGLSVNTNLGPAISQPPIQEQKSLLPVEMMKPQHQNHATALSFSTIGSGLGLEDLTSGRPESNGPNPNQAGERHFSQSTVSGSNSSSGPRTNSTGRGGLSSGFSEFKFSDSAPSSRPASYQREQEKTKSPRRQDSETLPLPQLSELVDEDDFKSSPVLGPAVRQHEVGREMPGEADDDMYFDDGGFEDDVNAAPADDFGLGRPGSGLGALVDENAFDDENFLKKTNGIAPPPQQITYQRPPSPPRVTSFGGTDGPYPSFAMPNPVKAKQRDSRMLLEDLPLLSGPVDPKLVPQRNPSEDAKRLGLSNRVPPLPAIGGGPETAQRLQAYHAALAEAANKAAADGRFARMPSGASTSRSVSQYSKGEPTRSVSQYSKAEADGASVYSRNVDGVEDEVPEVPELNGHLDGAGAKEIGDLNLNQPTNPALLNVSQSLDFKPLRPISFDFGFDAAPGDDSVIDDDFINDDDIVAAANAEVLATDEEGFYGQEFGFYANARPNSSEIEAINGGFFGADGDDGLMRNKSLKEPNLTPITERSEFSTRNSFISLGMGGFGAAPGSAGGPMSAHSPALARLPISPLAEGGEITSFDQLRKLRAHAFAGSNLSLHSDGSGRGVNGNGTLPGAGASDSPTWSTRSSAAAQGYFGPLGGGAPMSFGYSTDSSGSGSNLSSAHPVQQPSGLSAEWQDNSSPVDHSAASASSGHLPFSMANHDNDITPRKNAHRDSAESGAPLTARKVNVKSHSRKSSGADSVTYVREQDPDGSGQPRWVLERRRTSEQGQLELVAREYLRSGWI